MLFRRRNLRVEPDRPRILFEHEIDVTPTGPAPSRPTTVYSSDQRLLANPFLAVLVLLLWGTCFRFAFLMRDPRQLVVLLALLPAVPLLLQYHCLDCGKTGTFMRWKRHACAPVIARSMLPARRGLFRLPTPTVQMIAWGYVLAVVVLLCFIAGMRW
ncbi:hypothetical protein [Singulisphaera sp. PoT]|uniref:hypothetical protein n=1 Tax=Singulisphaera sp. PoT TaxID=3411797 RepID=UPI003BF47AA1